MPPEFQEWADSVSLLDVILWVGGAVGVVLFLWRGWPALKRLVAALSKFIRVVDSVNDLPGFMESTTKSLADQDVKIAEIHHEVHFNNGSSVKDAVVRIEDDVKDIKQSLEDEGENR